jgi:hypothetical protein
VSGNSGIQKLLDHMGETLQRYLIQLSNPGSPISKMVTGLGNFIEKVFSGADSFFTNLIPWINKFMGWVGDIFNKLSNANGFLGVLKVIFWDALIHPLLKVLMLGGQIIADAITYAWKTTAPSLLGGDKSYATNTGGLGNILKMDVTAAFGPLDIANRNNTLAVNQNTKVIAMSNKLAAIAKEKEDLSGFKDTDLIINKEGQFSLAGMERNKLDTAQQALDVQQKGVDAQCITNDKLDVVIQTLQGKSFSSISGNENMMRKAVPAMTPISLANWKQSGNTAQAFGIM